MRKKCPLGPDRRRPRNQVEEEKIESQARGFEAYVGFVFGEEALREGALAGVVDLVGDARKAAVDACELEVVIDLVEQVA
jgi:hypothetical protein